MGEGNLELFFAVDLLKQHYDIESEVQSTCFPPTKNSLIHAQECEFKWQDSRGQYVGLKVSQRIIKNPTIFQQQIQQFEKALQNPAMADQLQAMDLCTEAKTFLQIPDLRYTIYAKDSIVFSISHSRRMFPNAALRDGVQKQSEAFLRELF
ncbi:MAG: hypothetical protein AAF598_03040 [Bacteroidota bacterium]